VGEAYSKCTSRCNSNENDCGLQCKGEQKLCEVQCKAGL
jgi:hypothetical protein